MSWDLGISKVVDVVDHITKNVTKETSSVINKSSKLADEAIQTANDYASKVDDTVTEIVTKSILIAEHPDSVITEIGSKFQQAGNLMVDDISSTIKSIEEDAQKVLKEVIESAAAEILKGKFGAFHSGNKSCLNDHLNVMKRLPSGDNNHVVPRSLSAKYDVDNGGESSTSGSNVEVGVIGATLSLGSGLGGGIGTFFQHIGFPFVGGDDATNDFYDKTLLVTKFASVGLSAPHLTASHWMVGKIYTLKSPVFLVQGGAAFVAGASLSVCYTLDGELAGYWVGPELGLGADLNISLGFFF